MAGCAGLFSVPSPQEVQSKRHVLCFVVFKGPAKPQFVVLDAPSASLERCQRAQTVGRKLWRLCGC